MKTVPSLHRRSAGVLLPLASLPGRGPIGDLGGSAFSFVDFLAASGQRWWQMLPIQPVGEGDSPYRAPSAFAGSVLFVSPEELRGDGWLTAFAPTLDPARADRIDYRSARRQKEKILRQAFDTFEARSGVVDRDALEQFVQKENFWLPEYALFTALRRAFKNRPWTEWPARYRQRTPAALAEARGHFSDEIRFQMFAQWQFAEQWNRLKRYAAVRGIGLIGDAPIFVSPDSADVWAHPGFFKLKANGMPVVMAGVPPDYFSKTGQLWGNPHYRWDALAKNGYAWWIERLRRALDCFDAVRLDHFIGFVRAYEIPSGARTALHGRYRPAPGHAFFRAVARKLPHLSLIAEDLGVVTPAVTALRLRWKFPGMHVLQFEWEKPVIEPPSVVYTGTHDNDTTRGWFEHLPRERQAAVRETLDVPAGGTVSWRLVEKAFESRAHTAIVPVQDLLDLGPDARVNRPGLASGNWRWRLTPGRLTATLSRRLKALTRATGRA